MKRLLSIHNKLVTGPDKVFRTATATAKAKATASATEAAKGGIPSSTRGSLAFREFSSSKKKNIADKVGFSGANSGGFAGKPLQRRTRFLVLSSFAACAIVSGVFALKQQGINSPLGFYFSGERKNKYQPMSSSASKIHDPSSFASTPFKTLTGESKTVMDLKGKPTLVTNVASQCGFTSRNYKEFKKLEEKYGDKLQILLVPSNQFGSQEPGSAEEILGFAESKGLQVGSKGTKQSSIVMTEKSDVNGPATHPLVKALKESTGSTDKDIKWNFATKFLISPDLSEISRKDGVYPLDMEKDIQRYLGENKSEL